MNEDNETVADRMLRKHEEAQAATNSANRQVLDFLESGIDLALGEAGALVVQGLEKGDRRAGTTARVARAARHPARSFYRCFA